MLVTDNNVISVSASHVRKKLSVDFAISQSIDGSMTVCLIECLIDATDTSSDRVQSNFHTDLILENDRRYCRTTKRGNDTVNDD